MKEMPERIYLFDYNEAMTTPLEGDTEYIRKDSFIEKACEWLGKNLQGIVGGSVYFADFKKYMEEQV